MKRTVSVPVVTHDPERGLSYLYLAGQIKRGGVARSVPVGPDIVLDFDHGGALIGVELLKKELLHPDLKRIAVPPWSRPGGLTCQSPNRYQTMTACLS